MLAFNCLAWFEDEEVELENVINGKLADQNDMKNLY